MQIASWGLSCPTAALLSDIASDSLTSLTLPGPCVPDLPKPQCLARCLVIIPPGGTDVQSSDKVPASQIPKSSSHKLGLTGAPFPGAGPGSGSPRLALSPSVVFLVGLFLRSQMCLELRR